MARYARINADLTLGAFVEIDDPSAIPQHKTWSDGGLFVRPVVEGAQPAVRHELAFIEQQIEIESSRVVISYSEVARSREEQVASVKNEARRRILDRFPDWKQANMTARGVELQDIWRRVGAWTEIEQAEADALTGAWAWIKAVRAASDAIEALDAVPSDFGADLRWP